MIVALKLCLLVLSCTVFVLGDVSHLGYNRYRAQQRVRLQRLEAAPTPYPAAGFRPNREFSLPGNQPLFPLANANGNRPQQVSSGFDNLGEPQKPQLLYGSPDQEPRYRPQPRPQNFNGFNNLAEPEQDEFVVQYPSADANRQPQPGQNSNNGFNNFAEPQPQQPEFVEQSQQGQQQTQNNNNDFDNGFNDLAETQQAQQRPDLLYEAPSIQEQEAQSARLRQHLINRLRQAERFELLQQQAESQRYRKSQSQQQQRQQQRFLNSPQTLYAAPSQQQRQLQTQAQAESQTSHRFIVPKPARLTDNREETEPESDAKSSETVEDIETTTKAEGKKTVTQTVATTPVVANTGPGLVSYYPATAFSFVQPLNGAYIASANYQTVQPLSPAYSVASAFLSQQYAVAGTVPAQLQAW